MSQTEKCAFARTDRRGDRRELEDIPERGLVESRHRMLQMLTELKAYADTYKTLR